MNPLLTRVRAARGRSALRRFVGGLLLPWGALRFLASRRRLWPLVVAPALINVVLFAGAALLLVGFADDRLGAWWPRPEAAAWIEWLLVAGWYLAWLLAVALGLVAAYVLVLLLGGLVASPFNDALSERAEQLLTGRAEVPQPDGTALGGVLRSIRSTAVITGLYLALLAPVLLLNLVPALGSLAAAVGGGLLSAFFLALEYADTALERYGLPLPAKISLVRRHLAQALGFGLGAGLLLWIPFLNFLCIPIAVVAGTALALGIVEERDGVQGSTLGRKDLEP